MDKNWSEMNKEMQALISKKATFREGISKLLELRKSLFEQITQIVTTFPEDAFYQMPFAGAEGYHSKTLAYSIWHIFRIEDIVAHEMIEEDQQVLFSRDFRTAIHSPVITTGNELSGDEIAEFSRQLDVRELYRYAQEVMRSTERMLTSLEYPDLKRKFGEDMIEKLKCTGCVSNAENAAWLIEYWCGKDVQGLIRMPFSRHWIMHIETGSCTSKLCSASRTGCVSWPERALIPLPAAGFPATTVSWANGADPAERRITPALSLRFPRTGNVPIRSAARKKASMAAMNAACWKPVKRASIRPPTTARTRQKPRPCTSENTERRNFSRCMTGSMRNIILPEPRRFWDRIVRKDYGFLKRADAVMC